MSWSVLWLSFPLFPRVNWYTRCWGLNFNWQFLFRTISRYTWLNLARLLQCSNCSKFVFSFSGTLAWFGTRLIPIVFLPVNRLVFVCPSVAEVGISSVCLYYWQVRSCFFGYFGSRCFSSIGWRFRLHPVPLIILCHRLHIVWEESNRT